MVKYMLSILMDGIKDADMYIDYAIEAVDNDSPYSNWFKSHAKDRIDGLKSDYDFISREIHLSDKVKSGDDIAEALMCHLEYQMKSLTEKYNSI